MGNLIGGKIYSLSNIFFLNLLLNLLNNHFVFPSLYLVHDLELFLLGHLEGILLSFVQVGLNFDACFGLCTFQTKLLI